MRIKLIRGWFANTQVMAKNAVQHVAGKYYPAGTYNVPDSWRDILPSDVEILSDAKTEAEPETENKIDTSQMVALDDRGRPVNPADEPQGEALHSYDIARGGLDQVQDLENKAEEQRKRNEENMRAKREAHLAALGEMDNPVPVDPTEIEVEDAEETEAEATPEGDPEDEQVIEPARASQKRAVRRTRKKA